MKPRLEPYNGAKTRHKCPQCGKKGQFTKYIDAEGNYIDDNVGKCNKEHKCGYHYPPKQFFLDNPTASDKQPVKRRAKPAKPRPLPTDYIDKSFFLLTLSEHRSYENNSLVRWLVQELGEQKAIEVACKYKLGTGKNGEAIFWQIDTNGNIRTGKIRKYGATGKSLTVDWIHSKLFDEKRGTHKHLLGRKFELGQIYFGSHLLGEQGKTVAIVEGEKTAVLMSALMPQYTWIATGGSSNFGTDCKVNFGHLKGFTAIVYPDTGKYLEWCEKAERARHMGFNIAVSDLLESNAEALGSNADLVDLYLLDKATAQSTPEKATDATSPKEPEKATEVTPEKEVKSSNIVDCLTDKLNLIETDSSNFTKLDDKANKAPLRASKVLVKQTDVQQRISAVQTFYDSYVGVYPEKVVLDSFEVVVNVQKCIQSNLNRLESKGAVLHTSLSRLEAISKALYFHSVANSLTGIKQE